VIAVHLRPRLVNLRQIIAGTNVVGERMVRVIIGKSWINIVDPNDPWLNILSTLGFIFLMFLSGLEIDFDAFIQKSGQQKKSKILKRPLPNILALTLSIFGGILLLSLLFALMMSW